MSRLSKLSTFSHKLLDGGILRLGFSRPKVNSINLKVLEDMQEAFNAAAALPEVKGVLLATDNAKCFSAGLDLAELYGYITAKNRSALEHFAFPAMTAAFQAPSRCPKPVAAAVDGHAIAGAMLPLVSP